MLLRTSCRQKSRRLWGEPRGGRQASGMDSDELATEVVRDGDAAPFRAKHNFHVCACFNLPESQYCELPSQLQ